MLCGVGGLLKRRRQNESGRSAGEEKDMRYMAIQSVTSDKRKEGAHGGQGRAENERRMAATATSAEGVVMTSIGLDEPPKSMASQTAAATSATGMELFRRQKSLTVRPHHLAR